MKQQTIAVIGSGFSGLAAATCLADKGHDVHIFEQHAIPGGRARKFEVDGFTFDMGPSWYWMPDVFDSYFSLFGKKTSDYYTLERLSPSYKVVFRNGDVWDIPSDYDEFKELLEQYETGAGKKCDEFLTEAEYKYQVGINDLVYKPGRSLLEFADWRVVSGVFKMDLFQDMSTHLRKYFKHPNILELMEFPVLFLGAKPSKTPALYSLMNYADIKLGTWWPKGGMHKIVEGMVSLAKEKGVKFHLEEAVTAVDIQQKNIQYLVTEHQNFKCDIVVNSADYNHFEQDILPLVYRQYSPEYWEKRVMAPSSLLYYIGVNRTLEKLEHHNLFFDADFSLHAEEIYEDPKWPTDPLFYASVTSKTDHSVAPEGCENLFLLIPTAPGLEDNDEIKQKYFDIIIKRLEEFCGHSIQEHIVYRKDFGFTEFRQDYSAFKGNAYGLANTINQTAILKPALKSKKVRNLYYTGQLTTPGPGVPPSLISGQVVSKEIEKDYA